MTKQAEVLSQTTSRITVEWDRVGKQATWTIDNMSHEEAMFVLFDVLRSCAEITLRKQQSHHHTAEEGE